MTAHRCARAGELTGERCTPSTNGRTDLYLDENGDRYCRAHLPSRRWQTACTHSLGVPCSFCGMSAAEETGRAGPHSLFDLEELEP